MEIIDEKGRLFGWVNIIDFIVVLIFLAVIVAGIALVTSSGSESTPNQQNVLVTVHGTAPEFVADSLTHGNPQPPVKAVENVSTRPQKTVNGTDYVVVDLTIITTVTADEGQISMDSERIYIGKEITVDLGTVQFNGEISRIEFGLEELEDYPKQ